MKPLKTTRPKASKRADHKHHYEKIIIKDYLGYSWGKRCDICGRISYGLKNYSGLRHLDFYKSYDNMLNGVFLAMTEIQKKFPDTDIYELDQIIPHGGKTYRLIAKKATTKVED